MSLVLANTGTDPDVVISTGFDPRYIFFAGHQVCIEDFLLATEYVLRNQDLTGPNDPRLQFVEWVKSLEQVEGWGKDGKRLDGKIRLGQLLFEKQESIKAEQEKATEQLRSLGLDQAAGAFQRAITSDP